MGKTRMLFNVILCSMLGLALYSICISKEIKQLISPDEIVTRANFSLASEAPVYYLSVDDKEKLLVEKCTSSVGWTYKWIRSESTIIVYVPGLVDIENSRINLPNDPDSYMSEEQLTSVLRDISANPQNFDIFVTASTIESGHLKSVYSVDGDLSGQFVTYASHGELMKIPVEWTSIEEVTRPKLFHPKAFVISISSSIVLWFVLYFIFLQKRKKELSGR